MNEPQYNPKLTGIQNFKIAFEKGKLEQKKEELGFLKKIKKLLMYNSYDLKNDGTLWIKYSDLNKLVKRYEK